MISGKFTGAETRVNSRRNLADNEAQEEEEEALLSLIHVEISLGFQYL